MDNRQLEIMEAVRESDELRYWLTGNTQRLQTISMELRHNPPLNHSELGQCLTLLRSENYTPEQLQLIESATTRDTLAVLIGGVDALVERAQQERLEISRAALIECYLYISDLVLSAAQDAQDECEILEEELFFLQD